jgi:pimeloyl-ACP methyl ester carboxylesterase
MAARLRSTSRCSTRIESARWCCSRASLLSLSEAAARWADGVKQEVYAAADVDMSTAAETFLRRVLGDATWEGFPEPAKQMFTANGPAIVAELRGGSLEISGEQLGTILQPTLIVAGKDSPPAFAEVTNLMGGAMPSATVEWIEGGHIVNAAHPVVLGFVDAVLSRR